MRIFDQKVDRGSLHSPLVILTKSAVRRSLHSLFKIWTDSTVRGSLHPLFKIRTDRAVRGSLHSPLKIRTKSAIHGSLPPSLKSVLNRWFVDPCITLQKLHRIGSPWILASQFLKIQTNSAGRGPSLHPPLEIRTNSVRRLISVETD